MYIQVPRSWPAQPVVGCTQLNLNRAVFSLNQRSRTNLGIETPADRTSGECCVDPLRPPALLDMCFWTDPETHLNPKLFDTPSNIQHEYTTRIYNLHWHCRHADVVFSGLASHTTLLPLVLPTFSHLRTRHLWQPCCVNESCRSAS